MITKYVLPISVCLVVMLGAIGVLQWRSSDADERMIAAAAETQTTKETANETENTDILNPRAEPGAFIIGAEDAPVTIMEFSSLSCPHCATFHRATLPDLKKDYIETGKVKFVFRDFPLNGAAVAGSLLLKCIPLENRYEFMELLFDQQTQWAMDGNYRTTLKQYAALLGVGSDQAEECMSDEDANRAMFETMREGNAAYEVNSTPTFIILPGEEKLTGAQPYGAFSTRIEKLLAEDN